MAGRGGVGARDDGGGRDWNLDVIANVCGLGEHY